VQQQQHQHQVPAHALLPLNGGGAQGVITAAVPPPAPAAEAQQMGNFSEEELLAFADSVHQIFQRRIGLARAAAILGPDHANGDVSMAVTMIMSDTTLLDPVDGEEARFAMGRAVIAAAAPAVENVQEVRGPGVRREGDENHAHLDALIREHRVNGTWATKGSTPLAQLENLNMATQS
jgi:hypothetical protein